MGEMRVDGVCQKCPPGKSKMMPHNENCTLCEAGYFNPFAG
jgi:hypothetical protein